ncbi:MAG: LysR substrate-binding domain-containing protein [Moraxellaceae bacterium]|nr:LysR substrate-binding domain-containing protein [Moraxellaceae bacterium]
MTDVNLRSLDLNLLAVFEAVYEEGNMTRAALRLCMTQPAVSNAVSRLRVALRDPLFVAGRRGITPTATAQELFVPIKSALDLIRDSVGGLRGFEPASSERTFRLAVIYAPGPRFRGDLLKRLREEAPHISLVLHPANDRQEVHRLMREGRIDLLLDHVHTSDDELMHVPLWEDELVMIVSRNHPRIDGPRTREQLAGESFAVHGEPQGPGNLHELETAIGQGPHMPLLMTRSQHELALAVATSDLVGATTRRLAESLADMLGLQILPLPLDMPRVNACVVWHRARENDLGHRWFRNRLLDLAPRKVPQISETARAA